MKAFIFHLNCRQRPVQSFHLEVFETEDEALRHARVLLQQNNRYDSVEIVEGETVIGEFSRSGHAAPPRQDEGASSFSAFSGG
jgi:hypothetical protein